MTTDDQFLILPAAHKDQQIRCNKGYPSKYMITGGGEKDERRGTGDRSGEWPSKETRGLEEAPQ